MKKMKILTILPLCFILMAAPVSSIRAGAVTVDINDNYDTGLLQEESDSKNVDYRNEGSAADAASSTSSSSASSASSAASTATPAATAASQTPANNAASTASSAVSTVTPVTQTETTDLPRTGDDDRIMLTFIGMLASFSVFLTALVAGGRFGKNAKG